MKKLKILFFAATLAATSAGFTSCSKDDDASSPLVGTWQSVYYGHHSIVGEPGATNVTPDASETITFKSNGKGMYSAAGIEKEFDWTAGEIGVYISIAPSIHNDDNWNDTGREYELLSSTKLCIYWSNERTYVYNKVK
jgi:hypothetical protein